MSRMTLRQRGVLRHMPLTPIGALTTPGFPYHYDASLNLAQPEEKAAFICRRSLLDLGAVSARIKDPHGAI